MTKIVGIGANVFDTLIEVPQYPNEDTKLKALSVKKCGGGPCATGLVAAAKLGASTAYIGAVADDDGGNFLKSDFERFGVSTDLIDVCKDSETFSSVVLLSAENASRTCVFHKHNLPRFSIDSVKQKAIENAQILMVDGNDLEGAIEGARIAKKSGTKVLYDAGGMYEGVERLVPLADILIPSEEFALAYTGCQTAEDAAKKLYDDNDAEVVVVTQGVKGGVLYDGKEVIHYPSFKVSAIDSNGAGDVFHGAFAFAVTQGFEYDKCCVFSSAVSAIKCTKIGARDGVPGYAETIEFLKESGHNVQENMDKKIR